MSKFGFKWKKDEPNKAKYGKDDTLRKFWAKMKIYRKMGALNSNFRDLCDVLKYWVLKLQMWSFVILWKVLGKFVSS